MQRLTSSTPRRLVALLVALLALAPACDGAGGGEETGSSTGGDTGSSTGDDTGSSTGDDTGSSTGDDTGGDGTGSDTGDKPGGGDPDADNAAPELELIGDRIVAIGEPVTIVVNASDADDDELTYSVFGSLPESAKFDKKTHTFSWTPTQTGPPVFLTFTVSDGHDFDRETVSIEVVAETAAHPPEFVVVGDQKVTAGESFGLQLQATDPDGDKLTFGHEGALPDGASVDGAYGTFSWSVPAGAVGTNPRITFTVSDGSLTDKMDINFIVAGEGGGGGDPSNSPPDFAPLAAVAVEVGEAVAITLSASDPDDDTVTFGVYGGAPPGAVLDGQLFSWTPAAEHAGLAWTVTFSASDGTFLSYQSVDITVTKQVTGEGCQDDSFEPNESVEDAATLVPGVLEASICDTELVPVDTDYFGIAVGAGDTVTLTLEFDNGLGDLDLFLLSAAKTFLASSETLSSQESLSWTAPSAQTVYAVVGGVGQASFAMSYTLGLQLGVAQTCNPDLHEPNDTPSTANAAPISDGSLSLCPGDIDHYSVFMFCGEDLQVTLDTADGGDLDMWLYDGTDLTTAPLATATSTKTPELLVLDQAPHEGTYTLRVDTIPSGKGGGGYSLAFAYAGGCTDDAHKGNGGASDAAPLSGDGGVLTGLMICCASDWFAVPMVAGESLVADVTISGGEPGGAVGVAAIAPDGSTQLSVAAPATGGGIVDMTASTSGTYYLRAIGTVGAGYTLSWEIDAAAPTGCSATSCPKYQVCDGASGDCVSDLCFEDDDCPGGHICEETYCVNPCNSHGDCRVDIGYACKAFGGGEFCGVGGAGSAGSACSNHTQCAGNAVCTYKSSGGYCAALGCDESGVSCESGSTCVEDSWFFGDWLCAQTCNSSFECRTEDGYECTWEDVCLP